MCSFWLSVEGGNCCVICYVSNVFVRFKCKVIVGFIIIGSISYLLVFV